MIGFSRFSPVSDNNGNFLKIITNTLQKNDRRPPTTISLRAEEVNEQENLEVASAEQQAAANSGDGQDNSSSAADENAENEGEKGKLPSDEGEEGSKKDGSFRNSFYEMRRPSPDFPTYGKTVYWTFEVINLSDEIYIYGKDPEEALEREAGYTQ